MTTAIEYWSEYFEKSEKDMLPENFKAIKAHIRKMKSSGMREKTLVNHYQTLTQFAKLCKVPFVTLTEDDMLDFSDWLDKQTYVRAGRQKKELSKTEKPIKPKN